jgi:ketosteroid isomerase-like protein
MASVPDDEAAVAAANSAYYAAFEARDLDLMAEVWEHSDRSVVTHPGWPTLHGWARVLGSWDAIFSNTAFIQFVLTDEVVHVSGATAWVTCDENILQSGSSREGGEDVAELQGGRVAAVNVFVHDEGRWRMVLHHGSPVATGDGEPDPEG